MGIVTGLHSPHSWLSMGELQEKALLNMGGFRARVHGSSL